LSHNRNRAAAVAAWRPSRDQARHRQSIVVTDAAVIRAAIVHAIEATPQSFWRIDVAPLSCAQVSSTGGRWNLVSLGSSIAAEEL
jgi:broad specificity phosphatase PhoE